MSQDREVFAGGVAVITGAGSGIGAGLARRAAALGMKVAVADIASDRAETVAAEIRAQGGEALPLRVDVSLPEEVERLAERVHATWGDVRLLINNAGIETIGHIWEIPGPRWKKTLDINILGVVHGVREFIPRMLAKGQPAYVANVASVGGFGQMPLQTAYIMSKHAVQSFTECLALEVELTGKPVHVSSVIPGMVKTNIFAPTTPAEGENAAATQHRKVMREMMAAYGMDLEPACQSILEQIAAGAFWVSTHPQMTDEIVTHRIQFLSQRGKPVLAAGARAILEAS
jgi:NAD(P)-dependent dehydrogenase (short-subunit alcohol dehydrogenase family)